jgi:hypothetical protein
MTVTARVVVLALLLVPGLSAEPAKVAGKWNVTLELSSITGHPVITLKQDGEKLTGHYSSQVLGEADLNGTVKGNKIEFAFTANAQGTSLEVKYSGTVESKDALKGTVDLGGLGSGTFTAKRQ